MSKFTLQSDFLGKLQMEKQVVTVITINGFQLKGRIVAYDQFTLLVESNGKENLVYKSAVSTIVKEV